MKKILYTATNADGKVISNYVEANSNKEAIEILSEKGFSKIRLQDDVVIAISRSDLNNLSARELEQIARFESEIRARPSFITFINEVFRANKLLIIVGLCLFIWGIYDSSKFLVIFGFILSASMPLLSTWNYRIVNGYNKLIRAYGCGQTEVVSGQTDFLRKHMKQPEMAFDLEVRMACINAKHGNLDEEISKLEEWRIPIEKLSPGMYESRIASVFHMGGSYDKYVESMREAFFKSSHSPTFILDLALAEARLGEVEKAELLLKQVKPEELPMHGIPFVDWVEGVVEYKNGGTDSESKLSSAVSGLLEFSENPAVWPSLAVCIGDYALSVSENASIDKAKELLSSVWGMLKFHGENGLIDQLIKRYPSLSA